MFTVLFPDRIMQPPFESLNSFLVVCCHYVFLKEVQFWPLCSETHVRIIGNVVGVFHVRPKGAPRERFFNNLAAAPDLREFPCNDCENGEFIQTGGGGPDGIVRYTCNECGRKVAFP